jgi:hypothetical protein
MLHKIQIVHTQQEAIAQLSTIDGYTEIRRGRDLCVYVGPTLMGWGVDIYVIHEFITVYVSISFKTPAHHILWNDRWQTNLTTSDIQVSLA